MLTERVLKSGLKTSHFGKKIYAFESIDSTNKCAKAIAACGASEGTVVIAEEQSDGRGRMGRKWVTKQGDNLLFSIVVRPSIPPDKLNMIPFFVADAVAGAVETMTNLKVDCKWPNDLLIGEKKFSGILIEGSVKKNAVEHIVIGIGINVNQKVFPEELAGRATSLFIEAKSEIDRVHLFRDIITILEREYNNLSRQPLDSILTRWLSRTTMLNKPVSVSREGKTVTGVMKGLSAEGGLILDADGEERIFMAGDTTILRE